MNVECDLIFPLLKSSDLYNGRSSSRFVLLPMKSLKGSTVGLEKILPKTWKYLNANKEAFMKRKSSVYKNRDPFSIFGIGKYTFAVNKVAIAGFYKKPQFRLIIDNKTPTIFDDTCYFLSLENVEQAALIYTILCSKLVLKIFKSILFPDAKRPITKTILKRINVKLVAGSIGSDILFSTTKTTLDQHKCIWKESALIKQIHLILREK